LNRVLGKVVNVDLDFLHVCGNREAMSFILALQSGLSTFTSSSALNCLSLWYHHLVNASDKTRCSDTDDILWTCNVSETWAKFSSSQVLLIGNLKTNKSRIPTALVGEAVNRHMCFIVITGSLYFGPSPDQSGCGDPFYPTGDQVVRSDPAGSASGFVESLHLDR